MALAGTLRPNTFLTSKFFIEGLEELVGCLKLLGCVTNLGSVDLRVVHTIEALAAVAIPSILIRTNFLHRFVLS